MLRDSYVVCLVSCDVIEASVNFHKSILHQQSIMICSYRLGWKIHFEKAHCNMYTSCSYY